MEEEKMITCCMDGHQRCNPAACETCGWNKEEQERRKAFLHRNGVAPFSASAAGGITPRIPSLFAGSSRKKSR